MVTGAAQRVNIIGCHTLDQFMLLIAMFLLILSLEKNSLGLRSKTYCQVSRKHTMCMFAAGIKPPCETVNMTEEMKKHLLLLHNDERNRVSYGGVMIGDIFFEDNDQFLPPASNMLLLEWDDELAAIAQRWLEQCQESFIMYDIETCRSLRTRTDKTGKPIQPQQSIGWTTYTHNHLQDLELIFGDWLTGKVEFQTEYVDEYPVDNVDHREYAIAIWAQNHLMGCAVAKYAPPEKNRSEHQFRLVCNYANFIGRPSATPGQKVYKTGKHRSACNSRYSRTTPEFEGLCVWGEADSGTITTCWTLAKLLFVYIAFLVYSHTFF